ncbi:MAG: hypothetical protein ACJAZS_000843 [Alteromonas naphthalenivorans]|jgi:hypothetical protein
MCFSAQASFGAAAALGIIGLLSLRKVKKAKIYPFAMIPIFFAIQQAFEGIVWITYNDPVNVYVNQLAMYAFLFFAFFFWPVWIPFAFAMIEPKKTRRNILYGLMGVGFAASSGLIWSVIQHGVSAQITCNHIRYIVDVPGNFHYWGGWIYCLATVLPFFVSSKKAAWLFGFVLCASVAISAYFFTAFFTSVWCFFAAMLSVMVYSYL